MPPNLNEYVKLAEAPHHFKVSAKTLRRRRDAYLEKPDDIGVVVFFVRTRDGEIHERPSTETVGKLNRKGMQPEWYVSHNWLNKQFGPLPGSPAPATTVPDPGHDQGREGHADQDAAANDHSSDHSAAPDSVTAAMQQAIEIQRQEIENLRSELTAVREVAKEDKQLFANATLEVVALAKALGPGQPEPAAPRPTPTVDTTPTITPVEEPPRSAPSKPRRKPAKKKPAWSTLFRRR